MKWWQRVGGIVRSLVILVFAVSLVVGACGDSEDNDPVNDQPKPCCRGKDYPEYYGTCGNCCGKNKDCCKIVGGTWHCG